MISIILPFHNAAGTLSECVESVRRQTLSDWELLIADDGSDDASGKEADRLLRADPRIRVLHLPVKQGVSAARNAALKQAKGEYFTFLDADDILPDDSLKLLHAIARTGNADIAVGGFVRFAGDAGIPGRGEAAERDLPAGNGTCGNVPGGDIKAECLSGTEYISRGILRGDNHVWGKLYRSSCLSGLRFDPSLAIGEDMLYLLKAAEAADRVAVSEEKLYFYRINPAGVMERPFEPSYLDQLRCWEEAERFIEERLPALWELEDTRSALSAMKVTSAMLIASKMAFISAKERAAYHNAILEMQRTVKECSGVPGTAGRRPGGYGLKSALFRRSPQAYFCLYRFVMRFLRAGKR